MPDDFADTILTTGAITPGTAVTGEIEVIGDADWFEVTLIAGRVYAIEMRGVDTADGTLADPEFAGVFCPMARRRWIPAMMMPALTQPIARRHFMHLTAGSITCLQPG
ncbi:hypothetical protein [Sulfitobacter mediterraneus]|uniref:hypothetical protein n=1 Tax=Sulfitobacter mediterraneus TaxID=83219 RepID=UPI00055F233A|nr:hypothetical protein [Sulfitobacter mediterraneus]KIN76760.1 hypothetical protein Z950_1583 [Sulfitobacter mediterraneus KCTC 32188]